MKRDQTQTQIEIDILQYAKEHTLKPVISYGVALPYICLAISLAAEALGHGYFQGTAYKLRDEVRTHLEGYETVGEMLTQYSGHDIEREPACMSVRFEILNKMLKKRGVTC